MSALLQKIKLVLSGVSFPRARYNVFCGTNTWSEWCRAFPYLFHNDSTRHIAEFEQKFATCVGTTRAFAFGSGRMGLYAILEALDIGPGDEVILPAYTCIVVPNAILYRGAKPIYVDIDLSTFNIDVTKIEAKITPRTKALYAQHTFGLVCDVKTIQQIAKKHSLVVIEDAAHALGAQLDGKQVGQLCDVSFFSTDHSKVINTHLGGVVATRSAALIEKISAIQAKTTALSSSVSRKIVLSFLIEFVLLHPAFYWFGKAIHTLLNGLGVLFFFRDEMQTQKPSAYPYPARMTAMQAMLGLSQLENLNQNISYRRQISLAAEQQVGVLSKALAPAGENHAFLRYSFLVDDRVKFETAFRSTFDLGIWFTSVLSGRESDFEKVCYTPGSCPQAELAARCIVNIPTHLRIPPKVVLHRLEQALEAVNIVRF